MNERIKKLMETKNLSSTQFSDEIGIQRSSLSHILSGRNNPSLDFMLKIKSRFPEINLDWLLLGSGTMVEEKLAEKEIKQELVEEPGQKILPEIGLFSETEKIPDQLEENYDQLAKSEDQPVYNRKITDKAKHAEKVIILYSDQTFSVYTQKG
jgi:transcriptional regulator with XRE-family HTH domain